jgi:hypothetical protein
MQIDNGFLGEGTLSTARGNVGRTSHLISTSKTYALWWVGGRYDMRGARRLDFPATTGGLMGLWSTSRFPQHYCAFSSGRRTRSIFSDTSTIPYPLTNASLLLPMESMHENWMALRWEHTSLISRICYRLPLLGTERMA